MVRNLQRLQEQWRKPTSVFYSRLLVTTDNTMIEIQKTIHAAGQQVIKSPPEKVMGSFSKVLSGTLAVKKQASVPQQRMDNLQEIGTITKQIPTVSELLHQHDKLKGKTWEILSNDQNQDKDYRSILPGSKIYIDRNSNELSWAGAAQKPSVTSLQNGSTTTNIASAPMRQLESSIIGTEASLSQPREAVRLGIISSQAPTVSHLMHQDNRFRNQTWNILGETVNANKPFHSMPIGSEVFLNPATREITWHSQKDTLVPTPRAVTVDAEEIPLKKELWSNTQEPVVNLSQAVQPYMGKSYKEINCYELLVNGLKKMDIPYGGRGGLYSRLTSMALDRGMAENAYLNGEGIVEVAGSTLLSKNYSELSNWQQNATDLIREIEPLLNNGQILSFSTRTKGHTGIVSSRDDRWTFINSGRLDNPVGERGLSRGVGEEILNKEIQNWFKLAHKSGENLRVTLGELSEEKIRTAAITKKLPENLI